MSGGILLGLAGIWVGCQILGGDALGRLGLITSTATPAKSAGVTPAKSAGTGASTIAKLSTLPAYAAKAI